MAKHKYFAVAPGGTEFTRNSERTYTHMVVYKNDQAKLAAFYSGPGWAKTDRNNWTYYAAIAADPSKNPYGILVEGEYAYRTAARAASIAAAEKFMAENPGLEGYLRLQLEARLDRARFDTGWHAAGWCGRPDLAATLVRKGYRCAGEVLILEVNTR